MKRNNLISAIIMAVVGLILVIWPQILGNILCYMIGGALIILGVFQIINFVRGERLGFYNNFSMLTGIVLVLIGIGICTNPQAVLSIIPMFIGILMIIHGITDIQYTLTIKNSGNSKWWLALIAAIVTFIFGIVLIFNPFKAYEVTMIIIGAAMIYDGGSDLVLLLFSYLSQKDTDRRVRDFKG